MFILHKGLIAASGFGTGGEVSIVQWNKKVYHDLTIIATESWTRQRAIAGSVVEMGNKIYHPVVAVATEGWTGQLIVSGDYADELGEKIYHDAGIFTGV